MGNRAHVIFADPDPGPAVYLHWNGGPESVYRFLEETERRMGGRFGDASYTAARFAQVVGDFFDSSDRGGLSVGVVNGPIRKRDQKWLSPETLEPFDHGDNGVYVVVTGVHGRTVRRFVSSYGQGLRELSPEQVEAERSEAETHDYADAIRAFYAELWDAPSRALAASESGSVNATTVGILLLLAGFAYLAAHIVAYAMRAMDTVGGAL